jgi:3',5'-cyclic AMP phosphodiesterase CpdA
VTAARAILVSDTHLSPAAPEAEANWEAVLGYVGAAAPDLVIHLGDLTLDGARRADDLRHGRRQLDRLPAGWHAVPGNHDIGDNPWPGAPDGAAVDAGRRQSWLDIVGADHWSLTVAGWTLLAINAQLLGSGLEAEAEQWSWLERQVGEPAGSGPPSPAAPGPGRLSGPGSAGSAGRFGSSWLHHQSRRPVRPVGSADRGGPLPRRPRPSPGSPAA